MSEIKTTNAELIKALRICASQPCCDNCPYDTYRKSHFKKAPNMQETSDCWERLLRESADAIERLVAEVDRKDKVIQGLLDAVDKKNVKIDLWKRAWKTAYKLYTESKALKGEHDGEQGKQNKQ